MRIEERTKIVTKRKAVRQAHYREEPTGNSQKITIVDGEGGETFENHPIVEKVFVEAEYEDVEVEQKIWCVIDAGDEEHEFTDKQHARKFVEDSCLRKFK